MTTLRELAERLKARTSETLPDDWQKGRDCPDCGVGADRPKCLWEKGGACPRHDPGNYDPSPYVTGPDADCKAGGEAILALLDRVEKLEGALREIDAIPPVSLGQVSEGAAPFVRFNDAKKIAREALS